jgi:GAF domain-containing protein
MGKGKVLGVILVDNLYNQNRITEEDVHFLAMFANQAGLAIENAILYRTWRRSIRSSKRPRPFWSI